MTGTLIIAQCFHHIVTAPATLQQSIASLFAQKTSAIMVHFKPTVLFSLLSVPSILASATPPNKHTIEPRSPSLGHCQNDHPQNPPQVAVERRAISSQEPNAVPDHNKAEAIRVKLEVEDKGWAPEIHVLLEEINGLVDRFGEFLSHDQAEEYYNFALNWKTWGAIGLGILEEAAGIGGDDAVTVADVLADEEVYQRVEKIKQALEDLLGYVDFKDDLDYVDFKGECRNGLFAFCCLTLFLDTGVGH